MAAAYLQRQKGGTHPAAADGSNSLMAAAYLQRQEEHSTGGSLPAAAVEHCASPVLGG